ncbi:unnamed protein product [Cyprideis torosa]|uniref:Uncharacterized protein n=1 Tax=Cyprideis torosa TaxID=163714 RepID=A0A7R8WI75_9CRUS|nr:unnamed protein product [Cyprideis torosa]CAG0894379.1 unnamed protein product [Cyprideis torosa]
MPPRRKLVSAGSTASPEWDLGFRVNGAAERAFGERIARRGPSPSDPQPVSSEDPDTGSPTPGPADELLPALEAALEDPDSLHSSRLPGGSWEASSSVDASAMMMASAPPTHHHPYYHPPHPHPHSATPQLAMGQHPHAPGPPTHPGHRMQGALELYFCGDFSWNRGVAGWVQVHFELQGSSLLSAIIQGSSLLSAIIQGSSLLSAIMDRASVGWFSTFCFALLPDWKDTRNTGSVSLPPSALISHLVRLIRSHFPLGVRLIRAHFPLGSPDPRSFPTWFA